MGDWKALSPMAGETQQFLLPQEWRAVAISDWIDQQSAPGPRRRPLGHLLAWRDYDQVGALLLHTANRLLYPLGYANIADRAARKQIIKSLRTAWLSPQLGLMGGVADCRSLLSDLSPYRQAVIQLNRYRLYTYQLHHAPARSFVDPKITIRLATPRDREALIKLHTLYLYEEVYLRDANLSYQTVAREVRYTLNRHRCVVALHRDQIIAKASTNGRGFIYEQIGGVYTDLSFRNQHIARAVVGALIAIILQQQRKVCLFVREENSVARHLYRDIGFVARTPLVTMILEKRRKMHIYR